MYMNCSQWIHTLLEAGSLTELLCAYRFLYSHLLGRGAEEQPGSGFLLKQQLC